MSIRYSYWQRVDQNGKPTEGFMCVRETWEKSNQTGKRRRSSGLDFRASTLDRAVERKNEWLDEERKRIGRREAAKLSRSEGIAQKATQSPSATSETVPEGQ